MKRSRYLRLATAGAVLVVLLNAWVASRALAKLFNAQQWLAHTYEVLTSTEAVQVRMSAANSASRAYLLTSEPAYLNRYESAVHAADDEIDHVKVLTADNALQQQRIALLRQRVAARFAAVDAVLATSRNQPGRPVGGTLLQQALSDNPGGGVSPRAVLDAMEIEERRLLSDRGSATQQARYRVIGALTGATLLDVVLIFIAFRLLERTAANREALAERTEQVDRLNVELTTLNAELESRVEQRTRELAVSNQELEAFSYSVSHDLRAPLRTIDGFSLALEEDFADKLNDEGLDYLKRVRGGVQRMGSLIDALLQLSRVTRSDLQRERVDLSQLATLIFNELQANDPDRDVTFTAEEDVVAQCDARLLRVAFENLIGNALKFTSKVSSARIQFGSLRQGERAVYFLRDNGAGFDMQYVDRLFTAFQRLHGDRDFKGSGIGLATVSRIIHRHHGSIWAEGAIGQGATFFFTLEP